MLVLTRDFKSDNEILVTCPNGDTVKIFLVKTMKFSQARIGVDAPKDYHISRAECHDPKFITKLVQNAQE